MSGKNKAGKYLPQKIEPAWQERWEKERIYEFDPEDKKKPYYSLVELPYPSGDLHLGHWFTFATADAHARYKRMTGFNVFYPPGFDAFGLPAENAAIKRGIHPQDWTMSNIETMTKQFATMGTSLDWSHQAITCEPSYYRWNQWIFIKMFEKGIAYRGKILSNWCPIDQTVLANEHVEDGKCWRCGAVVEQKEVEQWFLKITDYADRLLWENTDQKVANDVEWPRSVREGQNNWIGKSEGAEIEFRIMNYELGIEVFTTRPDTLYGATFMVLAPEHPLLAELASAKFKVQSEKLKEIRDYVEQAKKKTQLERKMGSAFAEASADKGKTGLPDEVLTKSGVFTGLYALHPITNEQLPVWVADYVLWGYGTGAIMAVPAHDERDFEFAQKFHLPIKQVILRPSEARYRLAPGEARGEDSSRQSSNNKREAHAGEGKLINSGEWDGWEVPKEISRVIDWLEEKGLAKRKVNYHLHDWSVSRQRYWGTPIPVIYCVNCWEVKSEKLKVKSEYGRDFTEIDGQRHAMTPVPLEDLPVELPYEVDYTPKGKPPLASATRWMNVKCPKCGGEAKRDPETLDTFFDSSWYYYRYIDPKYDKSPFDPELVERLMPLDIYFGGAEHTLGHTLYARFFTKFFHEIGLVDFDEFAKKRIQHGVILGPDGYRMSKSRGNVVNPDDVVKDYGADTVRLYLCFMMPYEATAPWNPSAISGVYRFLKRIWQLQEKVIHSTSSGQASHKSQVTSQDLNQMHKVIKKVGEDLDTIKFNTAIAALMEWLNYLSGKDNVSRQEYKTMLLLLAPFAPYITEELYQRLKNNDLRFKNEKADNFHKSSIVNRKSFDSIHLSAWPNYDEQYLQEDTLTIIVQVNGRVRDNIRVSQAEASQERVEKLAKQSPNASKYLEGSLVKKVIFVPGKLINFVV